MQRILSTNLYRNQPLTPTLISEIHGAGIEALEIFCDSYHFNYSSAQAVRELASALEVPAWRCIRSTRPAIATKPWGGEAAWRFRLPIPSASGARMPWMK